MIGTPGDLLRIDTAFKSLAARLPRMVIDVNMSDGISKS